MDDQKILFVVQENATVNALENGEDLEFGVDFYESHPWAKRPNSTVRLNVVNLKAILKIKGNFNIDIRTDKVWRPELKDVYFQYDLIVVNAIASRPINPFYSELLAWKRTLGEQAPRIVFGTEVSWGNARSKEEISEIDHRDVYCGDLLLRHTARTDRTLYASEDAHSAVIQEFEIGIDTTVLPDPKPINTRKYITFVRAPEGRVTKNNEGISELQRLVKDHPELSRFEVREVTPPYSIVDYWKLLGDSAFLLFTSMGETFSYALNDAKALGVVTFLPEQMYFTTIGKRFSVDSYPQIGIRYQSYDEAVQRLVGIASDPVRLEEESAASKRAVEELFSLEAVSRNWDVLLRGESLNTRSMFIYGPRFDAWNDVVEAATREECEVVMPYQNQGTLGESELLTMYDRDSQIIRVMDYLNRNSHDQLQRVIIPEGQRIGVGEGADVKRIDVAQSAQFLQLVCRTHKVSRIVVDSELLETEIGSICAELRTFGGLRQGLVPVQVEWEAQGS